MKWHKVTHVTGRALQFKIEKTIYISEDGTYLVGAVKGTVNGWGGMKQEWDLVYANTGKPLGRYTSARDAKGAVNENS